LLDSKNWWLFLATTKDWDIVSWSICIFDKDSKVVTYLYWATNRKFWNIWAHQFLKVEMFKWAKNTWFLWVDLLWSPSFVETSSPLWGVWRFKWSLGGTQIEYWWSYDLIFNW
jgi:lipid II:glycine glycyltransferase (peptidoglycan interpeptide bridge formation enzyme)